MITVDRPARAFNRWVLNSRQRLAMPIATYPGTALTGATVRDIVTNPQAQIEAQATLHERYRTSFVLSAMDLSAEAEAFGCTVEMSETEIPTVTGRLVTSLDQARNLLVPAVGEGRTGVYLETVRRLREFTDTQPAMVPALPVPLVLGECIGPFSLAARLVGVSEAMELTMIEPELMHTLLEKTASFLSAYVAAFKRAGADGVLMAEPAAGLLSPRGMANFSSAYIRSIARGVVDEGFTLILHNCGAKLLHLPALLETGLKTFHFGAPMDLLAALDKVQPDVVLCGNLDPAGVFCQLSPVEITARAQALMKACSDHRNFVLSSGCDVPPNAPLASLDAFYQALLK